jgi:hypothetical protein
MRSPQEPFFVLKKSRQIRDGHLFLIKIQIGTIIGWILFKNFSQQWDNSAWSQACAIREFLFGFK